MSKIYEQLNPVVSALDKRIETKAEIDGYYEEMTVGDAEQLVATQYVEDATPYLFRTTGGSADVGNREYVDKIVGGTIAWNQLNNETSDVTLEIGVKRTHSIVTNALRIIGHKYLQSFELTDTDNPNNRIIGTPLKNKYGNGKYSGVVNATETWNLGYFYLEQSAEAGTKTTICNFQCFDLTQMFGPTIADYIYSLEQANEGAGVDFFRKLFPKDYYEYNAGELLSVSGVSAHETVGFNAWDEEWEVGGINSSTGLNQTNTSQIRSKNYTPIVPNMQYYFCVGEPGPTGRNFQSRFYDADKNYIGIGGTLLYNAVFTPPSDARYVRFAMEAGYGTTYKNDICINLSWSGTRNGEYEPYEQHSYPLDSSLALRGIPKLSASNELYYDGDTYESDGTVTRRYGVVDLGTLDWNLVSSTNNYFRVSFTNGAAAQSSTVPANIICTKYTTVGSSYVVSVDKSIGRGSGTNYLMVRDDAYATAADFKAAMSGVYLVYELATPTTEEAEPYQQVQICNDWGTEEYISESIVPVGHETRFPANLRDKLQHLPDLASSDGYYMIQQSNSQMSLVNFRIPQASGLEDGTYTLKATVSGGTPTYTWVAESEG